MGDAPVARCQGRSRAQRGGAGEPPRTHRGDAEGGVAQAFRSREELLELLERAVRGERRSAGRRNGRAAALAALRRAGVEPPPAAAPLWLHEFSFPARPTEVRWARHRVAEFAADCGLEGLDLYDVRLAADEALSNAVEHGSPHGDADLVHVRVGITRRAVVVEVADHGPGFDPSQARLPREGSPRGRGLPFMRALVDELRIEPTARGTTVRLLKRL